MKRSWPLVMLLIIAPKLSIAQSTDELVNDGMNTDNVLTQSMGYNRQSYSPLEQINRSNVNRLVPIWNA
ncbi:MAG: PQQ-dependent dehydrogenase, methanol/ethanol family, partial [Acidobacteriota bacterium]|nr:PQQ-dependent dehydrogenase, methanol/ethanol family [Acidobacteriota bacterium]